MRLIFYMPFIVVCCFLLGCNKQESATGDALASSASSAQNQEKEKKQPLVVKGFYIGMPPAEVYAILNSFGLTNHADYKTSALGYEGRTTTAADYKRRYGLGGKIDIWYDQSDGLAALEIQPPMVDSLFNVADLDLKSFAQQFAKSYGLPEMKPLAGRVGWNYRNDEDGVEVAIYSSQGKADKRLAFRKIPKAADRKFD